MDEAVVAEGIRPLTDGRDEDVVMEEVVTPAPEMTDIEDDNSVSVDGQSECGSCSGGTERAAVAAAPGGGGGGGGGDGAATSNLAKFKAAQDSGCGDGFLGMHEQLRIETTELPESKSRANSEGSSTGGGSDTKTPVPPSSTGKKRRRRTAAQIDRKYPCTYPGCTKAYGSEGSLTQHQRLKHRNQVPDPQAAHVNQSLGGFFLPLHRTPRGLSASLGRPGGPGTTRTVNIRPAGIDTMSLQPFDVTTVLVPEHDTINGDFLLPSPATTTTHGNNTLTPSSGPRQHLRARSNSMPVSFATPGPLCPQFATSHSLPIEKTAPPHVASGAAVKPQSTRRSRTANTPRSTTAKPPLRRQKSRSKSESLNELATDPMVFQDSAEWPLRPLTNTRRSFSDPVTGYELSSEPPFDWRHAVAHAASNSPVSSEEEAIDNDILAVLVNCDASETGESTLEFATGSDTLAAFQSSYSASSGSASASASVSLPDDELAVGTTRRLDDEWLLTQQDAAYLTTHLEKMSMLHDGTSPRSSLEAESHAMMKVGMFESMGNLVKLEFGEDDEGRVAVDSSGDGRFQDQFPGVSIDSFAITGLDPPFVAQGSKDDALKTHVIPRGSTDPQALLFGESSLHRLDVPPILKHEPPLPVEPPTTPATSTAAAAATTAAATLSTSAAAVAATNQLAALDYVTCDMDQADFMDVDSGSYGPLQWKTEKAEKLRPATTTTSSTTQSLFASSLETMQSLFQPSDKSVVGSLLAARESAFLMEAAADYAMEEASCLSSPMVCDRLGF